MRGKRFLGIILSIIMVVAMIPAFSFAEDGEMQLEAVSTGKVHILVENTTYTGLSEDKTGTIMSGWFDIVSGTDALTAVCNALTERGISYTKENDYGGYISEINGVAQKANGVDSGWLCAINNWYTPSALSSYTLGADVVNGDEIEVRFSSVGYGTDLDNYGTWNTQGQYTYDKTLKNIEFSTGSLIDIFSSTTSGPYNYYAPAGTTSVKITPRATNTAYQTRVMIGDNTYKLLDDVPIVDGEQITVSCGGPDWSDTTHPAQSYTIAVHILPYSDVSDSDWFFKAVAFAKHQNTLTGLTPDTFGPNETLSRAQFATILYRCSSSPETGYRELFNDVSDGMFYSKAVIWAYDNGVITGYENGSFGPADPVTREQMATMLYRYAKQLGINTNNNGAKMNSFPDAASVSSFATDAMAWVIDKELITGDQGKINPQGLANRAQCAVIMMRFFFNCFGDV